MDLIEIKEKQRMGREEVAALLRALADQLARHNDVELERGGMHLRAHVPDEVDYKFELEIEEGGAAELEIELSW